jgi:NAD-dependent deacetylase
MPDASKLIELKRLIAGSSRIVFLTGAGMSTESGIPDFRSPTGLYHSGYREDVFEIRAFRRNPERFYAFARQFLDVIRRARPNAGHLAIAALERRPDKSVQVITQNIDTLHQEAGSRTVYPVHGSLEFSACLTCGLRVKSATLWPAVAAGDIPRHAGCGGVFKPEIVFFGELLPEDVFQNAAEAVSQADLLVVAGTSLVVYPAASLPNCRRRACRLAMINQAPSPLDGEADVRFSDSIGVVLAAAIT